MPKFLKKLFPTKFYYRWDGDQNLITVPKNKIREWDKAYQILLDGDRHIEDNTSHPFGNLNCRTW